MMIERRNPPTLLPTPGGRFAHAVIAPKGARLAFIAGQVAFDVNGNLVGPGDHGLQARQCYENLKLVLADLGATGRDVLEMTIYIAQYDPSKLAINDAAGDACFGDDWPIAATTLIGVEALGIPELLIEISAVVAVPEDGI